MFDFTSVSELVGTYGYFGIFFLIFFETSLLFTLPGDSFLFGAGVLASSSELNIALLVLVVFVATFLASLLGYYIGVNIERLRRYAFFRKILKEEYIEKTYEFFEKYGQALVGLSRFLGSIANLRTFVPIIAGIGRMNYRNFLWASLWGSLVRAFLTILSGYFFGGVFPQIGKIVPYAMILAVFVGVLPILVHFLRKKKNTE